MGRRKSDVETIGVHMRLPVEIVAALDALAQSTSGTRGTVVMDLVSQAALGEVREVVRQYKSVVYTGEPVRIEAREVVADEQ